MMISGGVGITGMPGMIRSYPTQGGVAQPVQKEDFSRRFDSVSISASAENGMLGSRGLELRGKLIQEVRTAGATSPETVSTLRELVRNGNYRVDPGEIARNMLLIGEAV